ncbi:MAG: carboxymuconolactone decarboxylase family protein [Hyphomicrobiales bacterium]|nr:carboxymuconolactone decarboxylase family protein [Hyphomicrobiales bacterium]MCP4999334.1 carboxymuconolactone decarboxylase family protein [Hyphomicrobiales bacterium]
MTLRLEYRTVAPQAVEALSGLNSYSDGGCVPQTLRRLLEVVVSDINGCSYCRHTHRRQALALGVSSDRLDTLENWSSSRHFSDAEKAAFAWATSLTTVSVSGAPDNLYRDLERHFSEAEIVDLTFIVLAMNAWNRLAIAFGREMAGE